jgi:predicted Zn finger-like uncharacterized protein
MKLCRASAVDTSNPMSLVIHCPSCATRYQVVESAQGKRVRCQKCGNSFTAAAAVPSPPAPPATSEPLDPLAGVDLSRLPALPAAPAHQVVNPLPRPGFAAAWNAGVSNPSGGPTDTQMRLVCCGMLALAIVISIGSLVMEATQGAVFLGIVIFIPLMLVLGITGLISPNVVRACGKYGGHLPGHYKLLGWGVMGLSFLLMILMLIGFLLAGFEPDRPGARNRKPGLTRSETAKVIERISKSHQASSDVVRKVSFPVLWIKGSNPAADAERVLATVPGYVGGSIQISADQKAISFQYKGAKEIANQYALLLPGPTEIYMAFTPEFEE